MDEREKFEADKQNLLSNLTRYSEAVAKYSFEDLAIIQNRVNLLEVYTTLVKHNTSYRIHIVERVKKTIWPEQ